MTGVRGRSAVQRGGNRVGTVPAPSAAEWHVRGRTIQVDRPLVAGVVNVTPDSFSDGGKFLTLEAALAHASTLLEHGADILDIGGESTRPHGAIPVAAPEELARVIPLVSELTARFPSCIVSVDTVKSVVAEAALKAGAHIVNDVSGMRLDAGMAATCAHYGAGVILMHSRGDVRSMATYQNATYGNDAVGDVIDELIRSAEKVIAAGVDPQNLVLDPGIGFSKYSPHSAAMLRELRRLVFLGYPVMVGVSRKRFIGELSGVSHPAERVFGSIAANVVALVNGAMLFRVHDVHAARQALDVAWGIISEEEG